MLPLGIGRGIAPAQVHQLGVGAILDDLTLFHHDDAVGLPGLIQAVGNDERGAVPRDCLSGAFEHLSMF